MRTRARRASILGLVLLLLAGSLLPAVAAGGNVSEEELAAYDWCAKLEWVGSGYVFEKGTEYVTITSGDAHGGTFTSTLPVSVVFVKGGPDNDGGTLYHPPVLAGTFLSDGLPLVGNDNVPGISNIIFCGDVPPPTVDVSVTIAKAWIGDIAAAPDGATPRFLVSLDGMSEQVWADEAVTFEGLTPGESYTVSWDEIADSLPPPFLDEAGNLCSFDPEASTTTGAETFVAGGEPIMMRVEEPVPQSFGFTAENAYDCVPTTGPAEVEVSKIWVVDGEELTEVPEGVEVSFEVSVGAQTKLLTGEGVAVFDGLELGVAYPVVVEEVAIEGLDLEDLGEGCELVSSDVVLSAETVTPGEADPVTAEVTNAYGCTEVQPRVLTSVEIQAEKAWFRTSAAGLVELEAAPTNAAPTYEGTLRGGPDGELIDVVELAAGEDLRVTGLVEGETYRMTWEETDPLAAFEVDRERCTWSDDDSVWFGSETFVAGEEDTLTFAGVNAYDCVEVKDAVLPQTGASTAWLILVGLLSLGLGGGLLSGRRRR